MNIMYFRDHEFVSGTNVTIRQGTKWGYLKPGDELTLLETGTAMELGTGVVKEIMSGIYNELPEYVLESPHESLHSMYEDFSDDNFVTVVFFELHAG